MMGAEELREFARHALKRRVLDRSERVLANVSWVKESGSR